ncbi:MAG: menaquinone biosynthesis decarboxylase [Bacteroidales bacterium]|nr:menaquinone biosynthesis decarboxylase [Bacteroidales bacterium]
MAYNGLREFVSELEGRNELHRISTFVNPDLEITEITDRIVKSGGKALLFENNGTGFPVLINMFGSDKRMSIAIGREDLEDAGREMENIFKEISRERKGFFSRLSMLSGLRKIASVMPKKISRKGVCQEIVNLNPDLGILPVLKCWSYDGGKFITLPVVHTKNPETGEVNAGMYRMQIFDRNSTGMHWHRHKTGANHYRVWKERGEKMPVAVSLGGDPVYTYAATAPLPEGIDEYILAGFLRKKRVKLVKCITQDLYVPYDADIVIEGYVDTDEELVWEGPFGDHTGFYSLADWYPKFHVTAITHRKDAIFPATIVGVPPQEDAVLGKATERLFLYPIKLTLAPEVTDIHMPAAGVAHNLVLVKIRKEYPGQGLKIMNSLFGAGQMMFSKFIIVVDNDANLNDYADIAYRVGKYTDPQRDLLIISGPLDVLDHSSDSFSFGGKMGIDATRKMKEEGNSSGDSQVIKPEEVLLCQSVLSDDAFFEVNCDMIAGLLPVILISVDKPSPDWNKRIRNMLNGDEGLWIFVLDKNVNLKDTNVVVWQILSNSDPLRDIYRSGNNLIIDSTAKAGVEDMFPRDWPNIVVSDSKTIKKIDTIWDDLNIGIRIKSPSVELDSLLFEGEASVN